MKYYGRWRENRSVWKSVKIAETSMEDPFSIKDADQQYQVNKSKWSR